MTSVFASSRNSSTFNTIRFQVFFQGFSIPYKIFIFGGINKIRAPVCSAQQKVVAHSQKIKVKVKGQDQGHLKEKYYDSNLSNNFAQHQHADCPCHADFENNHFFQGQTV